MFTTYISLISEKVTLRDTTGASGAGASGGGFYTHTTAGLAGVGTVRVSCVRGTTLSKCEVHDPACLCVALRISSLAGGKLREVSSTVLVILTASLFVIRAKTRFRRWANFFCACAILRKRVALCCACFALLSILTLAILACGWFAIVTLTLLQFTRSFSLVQEGTSGRAFGATWLAVDGAILIFGWHAVWASANMLLARVLRR